MRFFILLFFPVLLNAASLCVTPSGAGSHSGVDWLNALRASDVNGVTANPIRGNTYYFPFGTYSMKIPSGISGTSLIIYKGATSADHVTNTGWNSATMAIDIAGPATINPYFPIDSGYFTIDGQLEIPFLCPLNNSGCGFVFGTTVSADETGFQFGETITTIQNVNIINVGGVPVSGSFNKDFAVGFSQVQQMINISLSYCYIDGWGHGFTAMNNNNGLAASGCSFTYNNCQNGYNDSTHHGEIINANGAVFDNLTVAFDIFNNCQGTGCIVANNNNISNSFIYGNIFSGASSSFGNGIVTATSGGILVNVLCYNNDFFGITTGNWFQGSSNTGCIAQNNIVYGMPATCSGASFDYDTFGSTTSTPSETHGQTGISNPFVSGSNFNLTFDTSIWNPLSSPYNVDPSNRSRTTSRGTYQYQSSVSFPVTTNKVKLRNL